MPRIIALDLETTGLDAERDAIVEFSFVELDQSYEPVEAWTERVNPGRPIPAQATAIHGITDSDVADQPAFAHHAPRIQQLLTDSVIVAQNHRFDMGFLDEELRRAGQPGLDQKHPAIDTATIERLVNSHKLGPMYQRYVGKPMDGWHGAESDARACAAVLRAQVERHGEHIGRDVQDLLVPRIHSRIFKEIQLPSVHDPSSLREPKREWLDRKRRFYRDDQGVIRFGFGQHKDQPAAQHLDYVKWMLSRDFDDETKGVARGVLPDS